MPPAASGLAQARRRSAIACERSLVIHQSHDAGRQPSPDEIRVEDAPRRRPHRHQLTRVRLLMVLGGVRVRNQDRGDAARRRARRCAPHPARATATIG